MSSDFNSELQDRFKGTWILNFKGHWIQKEIYLHPDLSWTEKILLSKIVYLDNDERGCFASNKWFASFLGVKRTNTVSDMISKLQSLKLIDVQLKKYNNYDENKKRIVETERRIYINDEKLKTKPKKWKKTPQKFNQYGFEVDFDDPDLPLEKDENGYLTQFYYDADGNYIPYEKEDIRSFLGVWIPKEIYLHPDLSWTEKILWIEINYRGGDSKGCDYTNRYFTEFLNIKNSVNISIMISNLKKKGVVYCLDDEDGLKGNPRILRCQLPLSKNPSTPYQKTQAPLNKNRDTPLISDTPPLIKNGTPLNKKREYNNLIKNRYSKEYLEEQAKACCKGISGGAEAPAFNPSSVIIPSFSRKRKPNLKKRYPLMRGTFGYNFVRKWNEEGPGNTTQHNLAAKTKTLIQIKRYLNQLKAGRFFRDKEIDPGNNDQVKKGFERWKRESHKFTEQELMEGIENLHKLFTHGYWPDNKNILPRGLNTLLYNERTNKSWFLNVLAAAPRPNGQKNIKFAETYSVPNAELMEVLGLNREMIGAKIKDVDKAVCHIFDTYQRTVENNPSSFGLDDFQNEYQTPGQFLGGFIEWIRNQDWLDSIELRMFLPGSRVFQLWKESLEGNFKGYGDQIFKIY